MSGVNRVFVGMIRSFTDITGRCRGSFPCRHGPFEIILKDGRIANAQLKTSEIFSILKSLRRVGIDHKDWSHFSGYQNYTKWHVRSSTDILTEVFKSHNK